MKINYGLTGKERKTLVEAISQELNTTAKYLGTPRYDYQIGEYNVSRDGVLTGTDNRGLVAELSGQHGFKAVTEEYDGEPQTAQEEANAGDTAPETAAGSDAEPETAATEAEPETTVTFEKDGGFGTINIEYPLDGFTPEKLDNLMKMVTTKAPLIKAALGTDALPIQQTDNALIFPWVKGDIDGEQLNAYTAFVTLLCKTSLTKKRVTAKEKDVPENPKYAFRVFLLSLGFIGSDYKAERKILLSRLEGNSSWRDGKKDDAAE